MRLLPFAIIALLATPALAQMPTPDDLLAEYEAYDDRCRGNSGDETDTWRACGARDYIGFLLNGVGWCYGRENEAGYQMRWHPCEAGSLRMAKP